MSSHRILQTYERQVSELLDTWFESGYTRHCMLPFDSNHTPERVAKLAASLFKRGGHALVDTNTGRVFQLLNLQTNELCQSETPVFFYKTVDHFFTQSGAANSETDSFFICDKSVLNLHPALEKYLNQIKPSPFVFDPSEQNKTIATVLQVINVVKTAPKKVIVIGGGVCCDVGALAGSLLEAQVHLIPSTLLSAVDAGIGGKSGVNHPKAGKNQIGRFVHLSSVSVITELFRTLTPSQVRQGVAEMVKHSFLAGTFAEWQASLLPLLESGEIFSFEPADLIELIQQNIAFKSKVVTLDPIDNDLRNLLNFGHTIAHLIEACQTSKSLTPPSPHSHSISHGIAVAVGMLALAEAQLIARKPEDFFHFLKKILSAEKVAFPIDLNLSSKASARHFLQQDKKRTNKESGMVRLIAPRYGAMSQLEKLGSRLQFMKDNTLEIKSDEFINLLKKSGIFV